MTDRQDNLYSLLLDLELGQLDEAETARLEAEVAASPELAARQRNLRELGRLLDQDPVQEPAFDLSAKIISHVESQSAVLPFEQPEAALPNGMRRGFSTTVLSLRELVAIAACITLFVSIFVPGYFKARNMAYRTRCKNNQHLVWQAMNAYAQDNDGYVTHAGYVPGASWLPTKTPAVPRVTNTRPIYKLVKGDYVNNPRVFICPSSTGARPMIADDYKQFNDFAEPANNSYSYQYMNTPEGRRLERMNPGMVLMADANPLFDTGAAYRLNPYDDQRINSMAHGDAAGQNVIYVTGPAGWYTKPNIGVDQDHIYRAGGRLHYQGTEPPTSDTDTFLIK